MENQMSTKKEESEYFEPYLEIIGGKPLNGSVEISGAKNATLPAIVAACLSDEFVTLRNVPLGLNDVTLIIELLRSMGAEILIDYENNKLSCTGRNWVGGSLNPKKASKIRHSLLLLGIASSMKTKLYLPLPGGCELGDRKHDMHISSLRALGNNITENEGIFIEPANPDSDVKVEFYYPTFGGTLNTIFASVLLDKRNVFISNAARNPEVLDVINLLNDMGSSIEWLDEKTISIKGVNKLHSTDYSIMPDRIIAATVIAATGITKGNVLLENFDSKLLETEIKVWKKAGIMIEQDSEKGLHIKGDERLTATDIETKSYPGFHTDIQPLHTLLMSTAQGESLVKETILDGRFKYCNELIKMGAEIFVKEGDFYCVNGAKGQIATIKGVSRLTSASVKATDIRGGAAVAVAGLAASGKTLITNIYQLERGYGEFVELFNNLGANVKRISDKNN